MILINIGKVIFRKIQKWIKREKAWKRVEGKGSILPTVTILFGLVIAIVVYVRYASDPAAASGNLVTMLYEDGNIISSLEPQPEEFVATTKPTVVTSVVQITSTTCQDSTTVAASTTATVTTTIKPVEEEIVIESEEEEVEEDSNEDDIYICDISELDRILLTNLVAREYGSDWVDTYEKAKVVSIVMNRVSSPEFPNDIQSVIKQPGQFDGYIPTEGYDSRVTDDCIAAVDYYFENPWEFDSSKKYFEGDGTWNYFY